MDAQLTRTRLRLDPRKFAGAANRNRTPGLHLTDVLRDIDGVLGRVYKNALSEDDLNDMALQGYLWEWAMTETLRGLVIATSGEAVGEQDYFRLNEIALRLDYGYAFFVDPNLPVDIRVALTRGCLILSPDGGVRRGALGGRALFDAKFCYKKAPVDPILDASNASCTALLRDKRAWAPQAKMYLLGWSIVEQAFIGDVEWHVQFPVGEYWGDAAVYERWQRRYEQAEISSTGAMVRAHVDWRLGAAGGNDPYEWGRWL